MATFFVEQLAAPAALPELSVDLARVGAIARTMTAAGRSVRWLHVTFVPAREACLSVVDASDEASVVAALAEAGIRATVHPAVALDPDLRLPAQAPAPTSNNELRSNRWS